MEKRLSNLNKAINTQGKIPILVLADDFSGATEMAGIGHQHGLGTAIQLELDLNVPAELIVYCTNTREKSEQAAVEIHGKVADLINSGTGQKRLIFKKIDSVLRGHILAESNVLKKKIRFERAVFLSANPSYDRKVIEGIYYINDEKLENTNFRFDPHFPRTTSRVVQLLEGQVVHVQRGQSWSIKSDITADIENSSDLDRYISLLSEKDLICGGADAFRSFLRKMHYKCNDQFLQWIPQKRQVFINGSTYNEEKEILSGMPLIEIDQLIGPDRKAALLDETYDKVLKCLINNDRVYIRVGSTESKEEVPHLADKIEQLFGMLLHHVYHQTEEPLDIFLTGGATAVAAVKALNFNNFKVDGELSSGVVVIRPNAERIRIIVKPGSYPWPDKIFIKPFKTT